jgi:hypothetical protein
MTTVLVCGGRDYSDYARVAEVLSAIKPTKIIHGNARGADRLAFEWARENGVPNEAYPAQWHTYGKSAGPIRNRLMLTDGAPDLVVAFPGGKGTADMLRIAVAAGVPTLAVDQHTDDNEDR